MTETQIQNWQNFQNWYFEFPAAGLALDLSHMRFPPGFLESLEARFQAAFKEMKELESGAIANPDENRMVGHYWLRNPSLAPSVEIRESIETTVSAIEAFAAKVHSGTIHGAGGPFTDLLLIGIGGSALGPQFVASALGHPKQDRMRIRFFDNTDPDGMQRVISDIGPRLGQNLCIVVSKSGGTKETRNGMLVAKAAYESAGLKFSKHALAVTQAGSELDRTAQQEAWISTFPMWDWVGGRTSQTSAVGLLPAALQGFAIRELLAGAAACDTITREPSVRRNPAALLAAAWLHATNGKGDKNMVVLPYKDRLELFAKYLQQLIMESLGKKLDRGNVVVHQGLTVLGNKGATDQHSYIQQLRDGLDDFFALFIEVLKDGPDRQIEVEKLVTSGDYLHGFFLGTQAALEGGGRSSMTVTIDEVSAASVGALIALFERAVGLYASLININAYHQPGVEAGKVAAGKIIKLQLEVHQLLKREAGKELSTAELSRLLGIGHNPSDLFKVCCHLAANSQKQVKQAGSGPDSKFSIQA